MAMQITRLTASARAALAAFVLEGSGTVAAVKALFRPAGGKPWPPDEPERPVFGHLVFDRLPGEEAVVRLCGTSCLGTAGIDNGEPRVEITCHGGRAVADALKLAFVQAGAAEQTWTDWATGAEADSIRAAARIALAGARTRRTAMILLDQYHGALRGLMDQIEQLAQADRSDEARRLAQDVLGWAALGLHLATPWKVTLAGPVNAGKSSLLNALVGYRRAIVNPREGTTRDVVTASAVIDGWPVELADTAGFRTAGEGLERQGIELARARLAASDLAVLVFDAGRAWSAADERLLADNPTALVVHNKCDLATEPADRPPGLATSALRGEGLAELEAAVAERLVPHVPPPGAAIPFTHDQIAALALWAAR